MGTDNGLPLYTQVDVRPRGRYKSHDGGSAPPNRLALYLLGAVVILALFANLWILKNIWGGCPECGNEKAEAGIIGSQIAASMGRKPGARPVSGIVVVPDEEKKTLVYQNQSSNLPERLENTLLVSILTVPRPNKERYLMQALSSLRQEVFSSTGMDVAVLVSNLRPDAHEVFEEGKNIFKKYFTFETLVPRRGVDVGWEGKWGKVTPNMYQLNLDFLESLISAQSHCKRDGIETVLLLEDDFQWCSLGFSHLVRALSRVTELEPDWLALRVSYGNNGLALKCRDLPAVIKFAEEAKKLGPLDSLLGEYLTSGAEEFGTRPYFVYRYNLLSHIGTVSSRVQGSYSTTGKSEGRLCYPVCYGMVQYVGLMPKENFVTACVNSDFSPCKQCGTECHGVRHDEILRIVAKRTELGEC